MENNYKKVFAMKRKGFNEQGYTWCIIGEDIFSIKDWLKTKGCIYDPLLKWHCPYEITNLPNDFRTFCFYFHDIYTYNEYSGEVSLKVNAIDFIDRKLKEAKGPIESSFIGEVGERIENVTAIFKSIHGYNSQFGWINIYTFNSGVAVYVWITKKVLSINKGSIVLLSGNIKKHEEFRGVNTTVLSFCKVTPIFN